MRDSVKLWLKALRSSKYSQARSYLHNIDGYCCLGVACEVYRQATGVGKWRDLKEGGAAFLEEAAFLPDSIRDWLGLVDNFGDYDSGKSLIADNDNGKSFAEIADIIESEPPGMFVKVQNPGGGK